MTGRPPLLYTAFAAPHHRRIRVGRWTWSLTDGLTGPELIAGDTTTERAALRRIDRALARTQRRILDPFRVRHPLSQVEAAAICEDLAHLGVLISVRRQGDAVHVYPLIPVDTLGEARALRAVCRRTDQPVHWHKAGALLGGAS